MHSGGMRPTTVLRDAHARGSTRRERLIDALVLVVYDHGYARATVTQVCARANLGRAAFYEEFESLQACFLAMMDEGYRHAHGLIEEAFAVEDSWQDGVRAALASLLGFFDREPLLARVWLVETLAAGAWALECRERHVARLTSAIVERWVTVEEPQPSPLAATGVMESVLGLLRAQLLGESGEPLIALLGPLMGLITVIYLGAQMVPAEIERCEALTREILASSVPYKEWVGSEKVEVPAPIRDPRAHRARACLCYLAEHPGASNRQVARAIGIVRDDQISTTLARLMRMDLLVKHRGRSGGPNAWSLSLMGEQVVRTLQCSQERRAYLGALPECSPLPALPVLDGRTV